LPSTKNNLTHEYLETSRVFRSVLSMETPMPFIGGFGVPIAAGIVDKFTGVAWKKGVTGAPVVLDHAVGYVEGRIVGLLDCGTHTLFVGGRGGREPFCPGAEPMTYDYYRRVKGERPRRRPPPISGRGPSGS
jgi:ferric-chelate reductase [NAD(P)H]